MAEMTLYNFDLVKVLPVFMRKDPFVVALATIINDQTHTVAELMAKLPFWKYLESLDEDVLDEIAWELDIDFYESKADRKNKVQQIKKGLWIKAIRGTQESIDTLLKIYFGEDSWTEEWFEYGGDPYTFRIFTSNDLIAPENYEKLLAAVKYSKNARSRLEDVFFYWRTPEHHLQLTHPKEDWEYGRFHHKHCGVKGGYPAIAFDFEADLKLNTQFEVGGFPHFRASKRTRSRLPTFNPEWIGNLKTGIEAEGFDHPRCSKSLCAREGKLINENI